MSKLRGFEAISEANRENYSTKITEDQPKAIIRERTAEKVFINPTIQLPVRADKRSAGYDFFAPRDVQILPAQKFILFTDVKAYMQEDEVLKVYPRSSLGIKKGLMLSNTVGIIDSSYYNNEGNEGNIGLALLNTSGKAIDIKKGERIAQGVFTKYLVADNDETLGEERVGGIGSSGK